jgi:hypothetical protein
MTDVQGKWIAMTSTNELSAAGEICQSRRSTGELKLEGRSSLQID